jgi:hypothetical protein
MYLNLYIYMLGITILSLSEIGYQIVTSFISDEIQY